MERKISHKVGVKVLSKSQLENVLPTYENLFQKIDICRKVAQEELYEKRSYQYNFMYDNVFSILGKRGTGKTSVAFTLKKMIGELYGEEHFDVVLPLIIPETIPENCTVLGWILAIVREEIEKLEKEIRFLKKGTSEDGYWEKCRYENNGKSEKKLLEHLDTLSQLFYAGSYNPSNEMSYYRAIDNSVQQAADYYKFAKGIAELWEAWIKRIQDFQELKEPKKQKICPLIYFIFDDVDLAPEKIEELLSVIIKYLSHPNIIVVTTADERLFLDVIETKLDKKIGRLPGEWRKYLTQQSSNAYGLVRNATEDKNREDFVYQTARMYLGKVLPTSTRYYLRLFKTGKQKEAFCLEDKENLGESIARQIQELIDCVGDGKINNFMKSDTEIINFYLKFFGNTSRQIGNVYIAFQDLISNLKNIIYRIQKSRIDEESAIAQIYQNCRYFLCVAINANHTLAEIVKNADAFVDEVLFVKYNQWKMYYQYSYLNNFFKNNLSGEGKQRKIEISMQLYALLAFEENLLLIMENVIEGGITGRKKIHVVPFLTEYIGNEVFDGRYVFRNDLEPDIFFMHYVNLLDRLEIIITNEMLDAKFNMEYLYDCKTYSYTKEPTIKELFDIKRNNSKWFSELAKMLVMVYGNAYLIDKANIDECLLYSEKLWLTGYQKLIDNEIKNNIRNCFQTINLHEKWKKEEVNFNKCIQKEYNSDAAFNDLVSKINSQFIGREEIVGLRDLLSEVFDKMWKEHRTISDILEKCSKKIQEDIKNNKDILETRKGKRDVALEYCKNIKKTEYAIVHSIVYYGIIYEPNSVINTLYHLKRMCTGYSRQIQKNINSINNILKTMPNSSSNKKVKSIKVQKRVYIDLAVLLNNIMENEGNMFGDFLDDDEESILKKYVEEIFWNLDIGIMPNNSTEVDSVVELGLQILLVEELQRAYIYQIVNERYENGNSMSSKELEKVKNRKEITDTYYFCLFKLMVGVVEGDGAKEQKAEQNKENSARNVKQQSEVVRGEKESLKEDIITAFTRARNNYVDTLIAEVEDE